MITKSRPQGNCLGGGIFYFVLKNNQSLEVHENERNQFTLY